MILILDPIRAGVVLLVGSAIAAIVLRFLYEALKIVITVLINKAKEGVHHENEPTPSRS